MQHERNYDDEKLQKLSKMRRLNIDPTRVSLPGHGFLRAGSASNDHRIGERRTAT